MIYSIPAVAFGLNAGGGGGGLLKLTLECI